MDSITDMSVFVRIVARGSLSAAGRELGLSPAVVSKRMARLEERLGVQLLTRTTRRLGLTDDGAAFNERCLHILADIEEAEALARARRVAPRGTLRVMAPISFGRHLADHLGEFVRLYPEVRVLLNLTTKAVDFVVDDCDVAIRIGELEDSSFIARKLAPNHRILCAAPSYLAAHGEPTSLDELSRHNCLVFGDLQQRVDIWHFVGPEGPVNVRVSGNLKSNDGEMVGAWASAGMGIAIKATWDISPQLRSGQLKVILPGYRIPGEGIFALYPQNHHLSVKVRAFIDFFAERFGPEPYWDSGLALLSRSASAS
jgi:DNA-binding transcriptional LysR family regulator